MKQLSTWKKFKLLLWKNIMIRRRNWFLFFIELLFPITIFILFALAVEYFNIFPKATIQKVQTPPKIGLKQLNSNFNLSTKLCYYPTVAFTEGIITNVQSKLKLNVKNVLQFKNESSFLDYFAESYGSSSIFAVAFQNIRGSTVPRNLAYLIRPYFKNVRWNTAILIDDKIRETYKQYLGSSNYIKTGFLSLQIALETSFIEMVTKKLFPVAIVLQEFPYPERIINPKISIFFNQIFPVLILLVFIVTISLVLAKPTYEKGTGIKELMKTAGLNSWLILFGWFFHHITVNFISILVSVVFLTTPIGNANEAIIKFSSFSILVLFLFLFCCAAITFGLLISSRFDNEIVAQIVGLTIWIICLFINENLFETKSIKMIASIFFPTFAVRCICKQIGIYELKEIGAHWSNIHETVYDDVNALTISNGFSILLASSIIFLTLSLYIEQLYPGRHGVAKHYYFIIYYKAFWRKIVNPSKEDSETRLGSEGVRNITEPPSPNLKPGIQIKHLCRKYGKLRAIDNISMDIYEGLITVILGRNGAGKTTMTSILTGIIKVTSGKVFIYDEDVRYNMDGIRSSLGYCPQNNISFDDLNVMDHFVFFGMLKGHNKFQATSQAKVLLKELNLYHHRKKQAKQLSDGMQRRLSLGMALMGHSKVLILDEPTSGLDSETRRELWNILLKLKKSRTVVITTHFMEEADALADRIAIIDHGKLACYGTPIFLKTLYGSGYHLTLIRNKSLFDEKNPQVNQIDTVTNKIKETLSEAKLFKSNLNCLTYVLPLDKKSEYGAVLSEIENNQDVLCITHIEMSVITLDEVFLKAGSFVGKAGKEFKFNLKSSALQDIKKFTSLNLQLYVLLQKRWLIFKRRYLTFIVPALVGMIFCVGTMHITYALSIKKTKIDVRLDFKLSNYGKTVVYYSANNESGYLTNLKKNYDRLIEEQQSGRAYEVDEINRVILHYGDVNFEFYRKELIVGAEFFTDENSTHFTNAMFSNPAFHGSVISINLISNTILQTLNCEGCYINSGISPLIDDKFYFKITDEFKTEAVKILMSWMFMFPIGLMFLVIQFMILPQMENSSQLKQLQLMCGVNPMHYWCIFYMTDLLFYFIWMLILITIMSIYQSFGMPLFDSASHCLTIVVILLAYGMPVLPFTYLFCNAENIFNRILWYFIIATLLPNILSILVEKEILPLWSNYLLVLYPQYGLFYLLVKFCFNAIDRHVWNMSSEQEKFVKCQYYPNPCCENERSEECYEHLNFIRGQLNEPIKCILIMIASTLLYFAILLILEKQFVQKCFQKIWLLCHTREDSSGEDYTNREDVKLQQERISEAMDSELPDDIPSENRDNELLVHNLEKSFKSVKVVKQISFGVDAGECFGLLGVKGAGKTTTFKMLTGNLTVMKGECRILTLFGQRLYLSKTPKKYFSNIGYCPQQDVIEEVLTGREMLILFGRLRGISEGLEKEIQFLAKCLGFDDILNRACGDYSGGNKRKLNIAMALIGMPPVILLDEPTTGVDPASRRAIWNTIILLQNQKFKPAVVLTTHSMEECQALCHKVAIMKKGEFHCYGTIPQLKTKYAKGFTIVLKLLTSAETDAENQLQAIQNLKLQFENLYVGACELKEEYASLIKYHVSDLSKKWSDVFQDIEKLHQDFPIIADYTITETSLEEVFLQIAQTE